MKSSPDVVSLLLALQTSAKMKQRGEEKTSKRGPGAALDPPQFSS